MGLEPTTLRLRVSCSTDWASRAAAYQHEKCLPNYCFVKILVASVMRSHLLEQSTSGRFSTTIQHVMAGKKSEPEKNLPWGLTPEGLTPGSMKVSWNLTSVLSFYLAIDLEFKISTFHRQSNALQWMYSLQTISESKLKSFSVGMMNAGLKKPARLKLDSDEKKKVSLNCGFVL